MYWNPNYEFFGAPQGWVCPKCGRVYSPMTPSCFHCGNGGVITTDKTTNPIPTANDSKWWEEYQKRATTANPVPNTTQVTCETTVGSGQATTKVEPNIKVTTQSSGKVEKTDSGAYIYHQDPKDQPKINLIDTDILDSFIKHFQE